MTSTAAVSAPSSTSPLVTKARTYSRYKQESGKELIFIHKRDEIKPGEITSRGSSKIDRKSFSGINQNITVHFMYDTRRTALVRRGPTEGFPPEILESWVYPIYNSELWLYVDFEVDQTAFTPLNKDKVKIGDRRVISKICNSLYEFQAQLTRKGHIIVSQFDNLLLKITERKVQQLTSDNFLAHHYDINSVAVDKNDYIYLLEDYHRVVVFDPEGTKINSIVWGNFLDNKFNSNWPYSVKSLETVQVENSNGEKEEYIRLFVVPQLVVLVKPSYMKREETGFDLQLAIESVGSGDCVLL